MIRATLTTLLVAATVLTSWASGVGQETPRGDRNVLASALDSARDEMRVGRFWHAATVLRRHGAHESEDPEIRLLLARAEAGWKNWPEVSALLRGANWLDQEGDGEGWFLLARALEEEGDLAGAAQGYAAVRTHPGTSADGRAVAGVRMARTVLAAGDAESALALLDGLDPGRDHLRSWAALEAAESRAESGDTALVRSLVERVTTADARGAGWQVVPRTRLAAGDTTGALRAYRAVLDVASKGRLAEASTEAGRLALALGDSAEARRLLEGGLDAGSLRSRGRAASALLAFEDTDAGITLRMAGVLEQLGEGGPALRAYDRAARLAGGAAALPEPARLARARLMATVSSRQDAALEEFRAIREATSDRRVGARNLEAWAELRRRQGRTAEVATLRRWLLEEYPGSAQAAEVLWNRGFGAEGRGETAEALRHYGALAVAAPDMARAGQARMRIGQLHLGRGRTAEAADVYEAYLADYPDGRRWEEASYWAARCRLELGDTAAARRLVARIRREEPVSYYAVMGATLLGEPYDVPVPEGGPVERPDWLAEGLHRMDLLEASGLLEGADAVEAALVRRARGDDAVLLTLAEELVERGRTITGINLGWDLRREGMAYDRRLLQVVYPFLYREMVVREAEEWGLDPIMLAAIIRQESAFKADIRSHAGAVGLMQVMPPTGEELARHHGPSGFREVNLEAPEVNLHLGSAFFRDMSRRYENDLPLVLSAYNAGPTRATRWRRYPEVSDPQRFTERIPFQETRGYVKNVTRNLGLYQVLYGVE